ncbi:MAG: nicotinate phosphoribosyltransferase [Corallococcus sp.]|nr:nicotinate phosphoribosyltransferase [Corallococcus sp.]MCM1359114.1 nicotinate phosphoribosyltransferase [Corallococcus sp.]MCM1394504.1 nicotinate phosphoribosyltransferase [Corallococcus sp.]
MQNLTLLTDFYELTMMYGYFLQGKTDEVATFDLFFRPYEESNFCIAAGLEQAADYIENLHFGKEEIEYLRSTGAFNEAFLEFLSHFKFTGSVKAVPEGTVVFPYEPLMVITAPICQAQLLEAALLNIVNFQTLIATKARRICYAAAPAGVLEFGLRRAQAPDASVYGARAAVIGGCTSTSNVLCAQMFGMPPKGTHAHSWVMSFPTELDAFLAYADTYPDNCLLLVDTYDTLSSGVPNAIKTFDYLKQKGYKPLGIRLDSGDLAYLSKQARKMLDDAGHSDCKIFASSDIDEYVLQSLKQQNAKIDIYGVGTKMITSHNTPSLGGVYKLANLTVNGQDYPKMKISDNPVKITNPGKKKLLRLFDKNTDKALADLICLEDEQIDESAPLTLTHPIERWKTKTVTDFYAKNLYIDVFTDGKRVLQKQNVYALQEAARKSLDGFWDEYKRLSKPHDYKVDLSDKLYKLKQSLIAEDRQSSK